MLLNFDFDGVVIDSLDRLLAQCVAAQRELDDGRSPTANDFQTIENLTFEELARLIGMTEDNVERFEEVVHQKQDRDASTCALFSGIKQAFEGLAEKHIITMITSSDSSAVEAEATRLGLGWPIVTRVLGPNFGKAKSDRIRQCCHAFNHDVDHTYMIGDAVSDVRQGKAAGVKTIAVSWGYQDRDLLANENPTHIVDHPDEFLSIL